MDANHPFPHLLNKELYVIASLKQNGTSMIGKHCLIGAGSLVTQNTVIPDGMLVIGSPAKVKRPLTEKEIQSIYKNAADYVALSTEQFE